jgi:hypothetical protein
MVSLYKAGVRRFKILYFIQEKKMTTTSSYPKSETSSPRSFFSSSVMVWLFLVGYLALVKAVILPLLPAIQVDAVNQTLGWDNIVTFGLIGLVGVWLAERTGFMPALDPRVSNRQRYWVPLLIGGGIAVVASVIDLIVKGGEFLAENMGEASFNTDFPASLFVYSSGTVLIEAVYRLFLFPVLLGLISYVLLRKRWQEQTFWVLNIVLSLLEPLSQWSNQMAYQNIDNPLEVFLTYFLPMFITNYPMNVVQAYLFRKYGFLASFMVRLGYYIIWHVAYGSLIFPLLAG